MNAENADKKNFFHFLNNPRSSAFIRVQKEKRRVVGDALMYLNTKTLKVLKPLGSLSFINYRLFRRNVGMSKSSLLMEGCTAGLDSPAAL